MKKISVFDIAQKRNGSNTEGCRRDGWMETAI
jgi:hypothetical protein